MPTPKFKAFQEQAERAQKERLARESKLPGAWRDPFEDIRAGGEYARESVEGFGEALRPDVLREVGTAIGGLNQIGALRSGGTTRALEDIAGRYGAQVGAYAKQATLGGGQLGLGASNIRLGERELQARLKEAKERRKAALFSAIGSVLGAGVGFIAAGPPGAAAGSAAGGQVGGQFG